MQLLHRQSYLSRLCLMCTCFMFYTSLFNIFFVIRRFYSDSNFVQRTSNLQHSIGSSEHQNADDEFQETFRMISDFSAKRDEKERAKSSIYCPEVPPFLRGPTPIQIPPENYSLFLNSSFHPQVQWGGKFHPSNCSARHKVALILPYRDRLQILGHFLFHMHRILQRQQLNYQFYVCEQAFDKTFNKGIVMNGCFKEILKREPDTACFIMHDVDLLLIDDRNMYSCPVYPRHLSVAIDKFQFYLPYKELVGGVLAMRREHFLLVNGYSTNYWGWGGEDDDMHARIVKKNLHLERPSSRIARYKMLKHTHQKLNPVRMKILRTAQTRVDSDGVNNVKYKLLNISFYHLFTHLLIDVGEQTS